MNLEEALKANGELTAKLDAAVAANTASVAAIAKSDGERDAAVKELADAQALAEKFKADAANVLPEAVKARVALERAAEPVLKTDAADAPVIADMTDLEIKLAVISRVDGEDVPADSHEQYVAGRFASAIKRADKVSEAVAEVRKDMQGPRGVASKQVLDSEKAARAKMEAESSKSKGNA